MLKQRQAKLLSKLYLLIVRIKGTRAAEDLLQLLLELEVFTRQQLNTFFISFLNDDVYVNKYLIVKNDDIWLTNLEDFLMNDLIKKYEEVSTWKQT